MYSESFHTDSSVTLLNYNVYDLSIFLWVRVTTLTTVSNYNNIYIKYEVYVASVTNISMFTTLTYFYVFLWEFFYMFSDFGYVFFYVITDFFVLFLEFYLCLLIFLCFGGSNFPMFIAFPFVPYLYAVFYFDDVSVDSTDTYL